MPPVIPPRVALLAVLAFSPALAPVPAPTLAPPPGVPGAVHLHLEMPDLPANVTVGVAVHLALRLKVTGPGNLTPPGRVNLTGRDEMGRNLSFDPDPVPLDPRVRAYDVNVTYVPPAVGTRHLRVVARGPLGSNATLEVPLPVVPDRARVAFVGAGNTTTGWRVPLTLRAATTRLPRANATLRLEARFAGADPNATWNASRETTVLAPVPRRHELNLTARFGPGRYAVRVHVQGDRLRGSTPWLLLEVAQPAGNGTAAVHATVPDEPTTLRLRDDDVNADGKLKLPGQALVTRVTVADPNGLGAVENLTYTYRRLDPGAGPVVVARSVHALPADAWSRRSWDDEDRFGWSPLAAGAYDVVVRAGGNAAATRTFRIRDVLPHLVDGSVDDANATPGNPGAVLQGVVKVGDANLGGGPLGPPVPALHRLSAIAYRWSTTLPDGTVRFPGGNASLDLGNATAAGPYPYDVQDGMGVLRIPFTLHLPGDLEPGPYRVTFHHLAGGDDHRLGSIPFTVHPAPRVATLRLDPAEPRPGVTLHVRANLTDPWNATGVRLDLQEGTGANATVLDEVVAVPGAGANLTLPPTMPRNRTYRVTATPQLPGRREGTATVAPLRIRATPPQVDAGVLLDGVPFPRDPVPAVPGLAHRLEVHLLARDPHGGHPRAVVDLVDWTGAPVAHAACTSRHAAPNRLDAACALALPPHVDAGRYALRIQVAGEGGTTTITRTVEVARWSELRLVGPLNLTAAGDSTRLQGNVTLRNAGDLPVTTFDLHLDAFRTPEGATWTPASLAANLTVGGAAVDAQPVAGGLRFRWAGAGLAPGAVGTVHLEVQVPPGAPPGAATSRLHVVLHVPGGAS